MGEQRRLPILRVVPVGTPAFWRFQISNETGLIWTGKEFHSLGGALYAAHNTAAAVAQSILKSHFGDIPPQRFMVPLLIEV